MRSRRGIALGGARVLITWAGKGIGRRRLVMPPVVGAVPALRAVPLSVFDRVMDRLEINETMDHFAGRAGSAPAPGAATHVPGADGLAAGADGGPSAARPLSHG